MAIMPLVDLPKLESIFGQMDLTGIKYGLGAKADVKSKWNPKATNRLDTPIKDIRYIDCSGFVRKLIYHGTGGFKIPDGSQNQRVWFENNDFHKLQQYSDVNTYITDKRLFIAFIKPFTNGCGETGHVWLVSQYDKDSEADTMESHGGKGVDSRAWNYRTLRQQVYSCYEIPVKQ